MPEVPSATNMHISEISLQLVATLLGLAGTALVIMQAWFWMPSGQANRAVLIFTACVPVIAASFFALAPRRVEQHTAQNYRLLAPMVWIAIGLPSLLTILVMVLTGMSGSFNDFAGLALLLAANAGRNLRDFVRSLRLHTSEFQSS